MLTPEQQSAVAGTTRITQIIIFALFAGAATYMAVVVAVRERDGDSLAPPLAPLCFAAAAVVGALVFPNVIKAQMRRRLIEAKPGGPATTDVTDAGQLLQSLQVQKIIRGAIF